MPISINGTGTISGVSDFSSSNIELTDPEITGGIYLGGTGSANYLDDYEVGTFTPSVFDFQGTSTFANVTSNGQYTKVGNIVYVRGVINFNDSPSGSGFLSVRGMPFSAIGKNLLNVRTNNLTWRKSDADVGSTFLYSDTSQNFLYMYDAQSQGPIYLSHFFTPTADSRIEFSGSYMTNQ